MANGNVRICITQDPGEGDVYDYSNVWDADQYYGCNCDAGKLFYPNLPFLPSYLLHAYLSLLLHYTYIGYFGPDCSQKECPYGDDPFTGTSSDPATEQNNEIQQVGRQSIWLGDKQWLTLNVCMSCMQVVCVATGGTFTLTFRGETTVDIPADAAAEDVKAALEVGRKLISRSTRQQTQLAYLPPSLLSSYTRIYPLFLPLSMMQ